MCLFGSCLYVRGALRSVFRNSLSWRNRRDLLAPFRWRGGGSLPSVVVEGVSVLIRCLCCICPLEAFKVLPVIAYSVSSGSWIYAFHLALLKKSLNSVFLCSHPVRHHACNYPYDRSVLLRRPEWNVGCIVRSAGMWRGTCEADQISVLVSSSKWYVLSRIPRFCVGVSRIFRRGCSGLYLLNVWLLIARGWGRSHGSRYNISILDVRISRRGVNCSTPAPMGWMSVFGWQAGLVACVRRWSLRVAIHRAVYWMFSVIRCFLVVLCMPYL